MKNVRIVSQEYVDRIVNFEDFVFAYNSEAMRISEIGDAARKDILGDMRQGTLEGQIFACDVWEYWDPAEYGSEYIDFLPLLGLSGVIYVYDLPGGGRLGVGFILPDAVIDDYKRNPELKF